MNNYVLATVRVLGYTQYYVYDKSTVKHLPEGFTGKPIKDKYGACYFDSKKEARELLKQLKESSK